ncbi:MAG TPA: DUF2075 domain-containing protein [Anaerolineaceae bacterium]|nr:DUF2075 domain-containing protein [Anaerolineaceae bacterium]
MKRDFYSGTIEEFLYLDSRQLLGHLTQNNDFDLVQTQRDAWIEEIRILKKALKDYRGHIFFEYAIPRMGKRIDVVLLIGAVLFVLEFKVGEREFPMYAIDQVWDYALDLKNFHETSHDVCIAPILISTKALETKYFLTFTYHDDHLMFPINATPTTLKEIIRNVLSVSNEDDIDAEKWNSGRYQPTPTIIEAAMALYNGHTVKEISRSDAGHKNLSETTDAISKIIQISKQNAKKSICFVTGVPGAGKTLVGLNVATKNNVNEKDLTSVFLSGNGPLVEILREALARNKVNQEKEKGKKKKIGEARREVKAFIQNVHHFRDEYLIDTGEPKEHIAIFDEAQRAWNLEQTASFMKRKKHIPNFTQSEPEFLISCLNRHSGWAVIICLVGGGQEINIGEAGITEWINSLNKSFTDWNIYISSRLKDTEYGAGKILDEIHPNITVNIDDDLHLSTSMRSFRNENVSSLVKQLLDLQPDVAKKTFKDLQKDYPIVITRELTKAKEWLRKQARGSERYGMVVSSQAYRLKPYAVDIRFNIDPIHWFLDGKDDVRSSYYLEDVATEFQIQGLELDWACVIWDGDFRYTKKGWQYLSFCGTKWNQIRKPERQIYLKNAYRVLLTRARQGMVIVIPSGDENDPTRLPDFYDPTYDYLKYIGFSEI